MISSRQITVMLAEDNADVRQSLCALLQADGHFIVVGEAKNGHEAVEMAGAVLPNVILMDISMPILSGLEATRQIVAAKGPSRVIVLSAYDDEEYIERARAVGAVGFLAKQKVAETLTMTIREVASGRTSFDLASGRKLSSQRTKPIGQSGATGNEGKGLTTLESAVLRLVASGSRNKQIAAQLRISVRTVEHHVRAVMNKLKLSQVASLADFAVAEGYFESSVALTIT